MRPPVYYNTRIYSKCLSLVGSTCSMLNDNDHMASTTTLQSHIPPSLEALDVDKDQEKVEIEKSSMSG